MRLFLGLSLGMFLSVVGGVAVAAPPMAIFEVGSFSSGAIAPDANAEAMDMAARVVLADYAPAAKRLGFGPSRITSLREGRRIVHLPQQHIGLPVMNRGATVTFDSNGVAHLVAAKLANDLPTDVTPTVDVATAAMIVAHHTGAVADPQAAQLVIWPGGDGERLAWHFYTPSTGLPYAPVTVVDAKTGAIVAHYNTVRSMHQAEVYPSNPVKSPQLVTVTLPLPNGATTLSDDFVTAKNCIDTKMLTPLPGSPEGLHICELQQTAIAAPMSLDFNDKPAADDQPEDPFAELHLYHHTRVAYDYFRAFDPGLRVQAAPLDVFANYMFAIENVTDPNVPLERVQNAFFFPGYLSAYGIKGAALAFGQGPTKDYAYDADIIYHEFTHAVVWNTAWSFIGVHHDKYGVTLSPRAMNEGLADYFSAAITGDPDVGEYAILDTDTTAKAFRSLTNPDACPSAIGGEEHQDATLFSGSLWDVRSTLPVEVRGDFDLAIFAALNAVPVDDLGYEEFASIIVEHIKMTATLGAQVAEQLTMAFTKRGVLPQCARILEYQGKSMNGPAAVPGIDKVWWSIGTWAANLGDSQLGYVPGVMQVHVPLPQNTVSMTVDFVGGGPNLEFGPEAIVRLGDEPIEFTLSPLATTADVLRVSPASGSQVNEDFRRYSVKIDITGGAKNAYVMIVNPTDFAGAYTDLNFTMIQGDQLDKADGCSCEVPGSSEGPVGFSFVSLAVWVGLFGRRRKR